MKLLPVLIVFILSLIAHADDKPLLELESLTTKSGRTYEGVKVMSRTADKAKVYHVGGMANVKFTDLPDDIVKQLGGYDADAAKVAAEEKAELDRQIAIAQRKRMVELAKKKRTRKVTEIREIEVKGKYYNDVWNKFFDQKININVNLEGYVILSNSGIVSAQTHLKGRELASFIEALEKGKEWQKQSAKEKLEVSKPIKSFGVRVGVRFFAANNGKQNFIILKLSEFMGNNRMRDIDMYLDQKNVNALIDKMKQIPLEYKKKKAASKALK